MDNSQTMNNRVYLFLLTITAAFGGFLFGYDTAIISGTIGFVKTKFELDTAMEGWFVSSALVGCLIGVALAGELSDRFGRKKTLLLSALLFSISAIGCAFSGSHTELILFRLLGGVGVGIASMVSPIYISEVSPPFLRGRMVALYQFAITIGILSAYFTNAGLLQLSDHFSTGSSNQLIQQFLVSDVWRSMFGSEFIPALIFLIAIFFVPESPRWCALKGKRHQAEQILCKINGNEVGQTELLAIENSFQKEKTTSWKSLFSGKLKVALLAGIALAMLSQFTGINAIIYYGPRIMEAAGLQLSDALGGQVIIGLVNVIATIYAIRKIDSYGRKKLLNTGVIGMFVSLLLVAALFAFNITEGYLILIFILTFITFFAIGFGPVVWVLLSELYPTHVRGRATSIATFALWIGVAIIGQLVPWMLESIGPSGTFIIFALCCIPVPFILRLIPETKGMSLEEIEKVWKNKNE